MSDKGVEPLSTASGLRLSPRIVVGAAAALALGLVALILGGQLSWGMELLVLALMLAPPALALALPRPQTAPAEIIRYREEAPPPDAAPAAEAIVLEDLPLPVMTADPASGRIVYANRAARLFHDHVLRAGRHSGTGLVGESLAQLLSRLGTTEHIPLDDPAHLPWNGKLRVGEEVVELRVSALRDRDLNYQFALLVWSTITGDMRHADEFENKVQKAVEELGGTAKRLSASAEQLAQNARDNRMTAGSANASAQEASDNFNTIAAATEELSTSISEIARQVDQSSKLARNAVDQASETGVVMSELSRLADEIGKIVSLIRTIAGQTNLLALNATIEASRAGNAGKGFAVVAHEVKSLARQTSEATDGIAGQIQAVQKTVARASESVRGIMGIIGDVNGLVTTISDSVQQQGRATEDIASSVHAATDRTREVTTHISDVSARAGDTEGRAIEMSDSTKIVAERTAYLATHTESYLRGIRRATFRQAQSALDAHLLLLKDAILAHGQPFRIVNDRLHVGDVDLNGRNDIIDSVTDRVGGTATIFQGDLRICTNVKTQDGQRAVGTKLAAGSTYDIVLRQGQTYRGQAEILGRTFLSIYDPIKGPDGKVLGILYVGVPIVS